MADAIALANDVWRVEVTPNHGATLARGQLRRKGEWVDILRPTPEKSRTTAPDTASYPLIPWSNRLRDSLLIWEGRAHRLRPWPGATTAMHGTAFEFPWEVTNLDRDRITLSFDTRPLTGVNFPWDFTSSIEYRLDADRLVVSTTVTNVDDETFPVGFGHHPYFVRRPLIDSTTLGQEAELGIACRSAYPLEDALAVGPAGPVDARLDFQARRTLGEAFVDDCLTDRTPGPVATILYPGVAELVLEADEVFSHVVVYIPTGQGFFAVEPVTHANDALTLHARGITDLGVRGLDPGQTVDGTFSIAATVLG
ncbi:MAG: aldose epimerase [Demequinaceae bacterium]|nr:aldose epimerase [Demequinaceae bacterium]